MSRILALGLLADGCAAPTHAGDTAAPFVQPGLDDPTARPWTKAGAWYPDDRFELDIEVGALIAAAQATPRPARAILTPHAGLAYSGAMAGAAWARVQPPRTMVVLGPNHYPDGVDAGLWTDGPWLVPGHALAIHPELSARLLELDGQLEPDRDAFAHHEVEMNLPFIQFVRPDAELVISGWRDNQDWDFRDFDLDQIEAAGRAIATLIDQREAAGDEVLLVITVDLVHYVPLTQSDREDPILLDHIATLDVEGLYEDVRADGLSICGEVPAAIGMVALRELGVPGFDWTARGTSFDRSGDASAVVGYPAGVVYR